MNIAHFYSGLATAVEYLTAAAALLILASCADDLVIDARYWARRLLVRLGRRARPHVPTADELRKVPEQPIVIVVPAWHESGVIGTMLDHTLRQLQYRDYMVFVGTYPNDAGTIAEVELRCAVDHRIRRIELPHAGPTCKADCLNHIVSAVFAHERVTGRSFSALVMHDCEDVLHPMELAYFNAMLRRYHMIQLPVIALERDWSHMVAGTYMDEFAEAHGKEMLVRQHLCASIPSAGVGTCFSRTAVLALWRQSGGRPFRNESLTEDYEIGMRVSELGLRARFSLVQLAEGPSGAARDRKRPRVRADRILSVREFFPAGFRAAYRQRARWMLGIGLQAWEQIPLRGRRWPLVYMMLHDRKGVFTSLVPGVAYLVLAYVLLFQWGVSRGWWGAYDPVLFREGSAWQTLLYVNGALLVIRAVQRAYFTGWMYGWAQGLAAVPRLFVSNAVNFMAAARAWRLYLAHRVTGRPLAWDKTAHEFPADPDVTVPAPLPAVPAPALQGGPRSMRLPAGSDRLRPRSGSKRRTVA